MNTSTYSSEVIDPAIIHSTNQVDKWANMIVHMALNGRLRQIVINGKIAQPSNVNYLIINFNTSDYF